jgi:hypothetical protein
MSDIQMGEPVAKLFGTLPVYDTPQQPSTIVRTAAEGEDTRRAWVGLTDDEIDDAARYCVKSGQSVNAAIRAIEAKLKEKNT